MSRNVAALFLSLSCIALAGSSFAADKPVVVIETTLGNIEVELNAEKAPITVKNFLAYVDDKFYDGTVFHRVIPTFMIQGGGFTADLKEKPTKAPIKNEADNGLNNDAGTIAMARLNEPDTANAQFFINVQNNAALNHAGPGPAFGYCVFGKVTAGMDVVNKIKDTPTGNGVGNHEGMMMPLQDVPTTPVVIKSIKRK